MIVLGEGKFTAHKHEESFWGDGSDLYVVWEGNLHEYVKLSKLMALNT